MIAAAYGSNEWRCVGKASSWLSPIFDEWHINCAIQYISAFRSKKDVWSFSCDFGHVTKLTNRGLSWMPVENPVETLRKWPLILFA